MVLQKVFFKFNFSISNCNYLLIIDKKGSAFVEFFDESSVDKAMEKACEKSR